LIGIVDKCCGLDIYLQHPFFIDTLLVDREKQQQPFGIDDEFLSLKMEDLSLNYQYFLKKTIKFLCLGIESIYYDSL
jgi:hypothetical protein